MNNNFSILNSYAYDIKSKFVSALSWLATPCRKILGDRNFRLITLAKEKPISTVSIVATVFFIFIVFSARFNSRASLLKKLRHFSMIEERNWIKDKTNQFWNMNHKNEEVKLEESNKPQPFVAESKDLTTIETFDEVIAQNVLPPPKPEETIQFVDEIKNLAPPTFSMLFHIHADEFGHSSKYEGGSSSDAVKYLLSYLTSANRLIDQIYPIELIEELGNAIDTKAKNDIESSLNIEKILLQTKDKIIASFQTQKPLLIMGGWTGDPAGHAIYYEILPTSNTTANFRLYNSGSGINYHSHVEEGYKTKYQAYVEWQGIDRKQLESDFFLQALIELRSYKNHPSNWSKTEYSEKDIYEALRGILKPTADTADAPITLQKRSPQRSGVCSWKSLMAFVNTKMNSDDYKRFKCNIKLESLRDYVQNRRSGIATNEWRLVKKSYQNICASILLLYRKQLVGDAYLQTAKNILNPIHQWVHSHAPIRLNRNIQMPLFKYESNTSLGSVENKHSLPIKLEDMSRAPSSKDIISQPWTKIFDQFTALDLANPTTIQEKLKNAIDLSNNTWLNREDISLHKGIIHTIRHLQSDSKFWEQATNKNSKTAETLIVQLGELAKLFLKSCYTIPKAYIIFPEKVYVLDKIVYLQKLLCILRQDPKWPTLSSQSNFCTNKTHLFLNFVEAALQREIYDWRFLDSSDSVGVTNYFYIKNGHISGSTLKIAGAAHQYLFFEEGSPSPKSFQNIIRNNYPEVIQAITEKETEFPELSQLAQDARIFCSEYLPEWIKAIRDADIARMQINSGYIAPLATLNRDSDLELIFKIVDKEKSTTVDIAYKGVTGDIVNNPEVQKNLSYRFSIYSRQYRQINDPSINKILGSMKYGPLENEKILLSTSAKIEQLEMPDEDFKELSHIFISAKLQHVETLAYFTKHPERLKDTDYQTLFHIALFKNKLLLKNLKKPGFETQLGRFILNNYERFLQENEVQAAVNLLKIAHQLRSFCPENKFFASTTLQLKNLLAKEHLAASEKCYLYAELIAQLGHQNDLSEEEVSLIIAGSLFIEENQTHCNYTEDPYTAEEVRDALMKHATKIQDVLEKNHPNVNVLNIILKQVRPDVREDKEWTLEIIKDEFPAFKTIDGKYTLYPLISKLISENEQVLLPLNIRENALFKQLFSGINQGYYLPGNVYSFKDKKGRETLVHLKEDHLIIDQKLDTGKEEWYRFIPSHLFIKQKKTGFLKIEKFSILGSRYLVNRYSHWQSLNTTQNRAVKVCVLDLKTGKQQYELQVEYLNKDNLSELKLLNVTKISDGLQLGKPSNLFTLFEDPSYVHEWYDQRGILQNIELPRFNLSFTPDSKQRDVLRCDQFSKFVLDIDEPCKELGAHHHYIRLKNDKGQSKIILPKQNLEAPEEMEVLQPAYEIDRLLGFHQLDPQKYLAFDLQKNGHLHTPSKEANLYLAYVLTATQEYKKAAYYLKKFGAKLSAYTKDEAEILQKISEIQKINGDQSGNGNALRLYANYLLIKNASYDSQEVSKDILNSVNSNYDLYLEHYSHATVFKLKPQEEILILKTVLKKQFQAKQYLRLKELDPITASKLTLPVPEDFNSNKNTKIHNKFKLSLYSKSKNTPVKALTRPCHELEWNFTLYYDIARRGDFEQKERLKNLLCFARIENSSKETNLAYFFETVLENPEEFPEIPIDEQEQNNWKKMVKKTAKKLLKPQKAENTETKNPIEPLDLSKVNFRFDATLDDVKPIKTAYTFTPLESLAASCLEAKCFEPLQDTKKHEYGPLFDLLKKMETDNPVENLEILRLENDLKEYQNREPSPSYTLGSSDLTKVKEVLSKNKDDDEGKIVTLQNKILDIANRTPSSTEILNQYLLEKGSGQRKVITLEELLVYFARQDFSNISQRNPSLNEANVNNLVNNISDYLLLSTKQQQRERAEASLKKLEKCIANGISAETEEYKDLVDQLAQIMLAERSFDPKLYPAFLVFEYFTTISMRASQVEKLETFLKEGDQNLIMEMIMGSGKSKVLLPLLGFMRANGNNLSMLIVPKPLFESISQDTQNILCYAFSQSLHTLHFDRNTPFTKEALQQILGDLDVIQKEKACLIMTSKSVQCLLLKYMEECDLHFTTQESDGTLSEELKLGQQILRVLIQSGHPIIDEADTILNVMHEVSFSAGRRLSPLCHEVELISELYSLIYEDPTIKSLVRVESDPNPNLKAPILTESLYADKIKRPLAEAFIQRLDSIKFESALLTTKLHHYFQKLNASDKEHLLHYLCRDPKHIDTAQAYYDKQDNEIQDIIALAGEQISHLLPYALTRVCDVKYGLDTQHSTVFAIPFSAANTPSMGSHFSNAHITMNYTFQSYMKKGITFEIVERQVQFLQEKAMNEMREKEEIKAWKDTRAGKAFDRLKGPLDLPLFKYKPAHIQAIVKYINETPQVKRDFVTYQVLPQLELFEKKMSSNPHHLAALFDLIIGFTGTLWNGLSMHHKVKPQSEVGTDAKTLSLLWEHSKTNAITMQEGTPVEMLQQLKDNTIDFDMISDAGGYFKKGSNSEIAHLIASAGKETVFYNEKGEQTITLAADEVPLTHPKKSPEKRKTFLDQSHTVGADIPQKRNAVSLVTIGQNILLRDILQAVWRLRGLDKSQRVRFLITEEVAEIIRHKLKLADNHPIQLEAILRFAIANQALQQGTDNYKALREELYNIPQQILMKVLLQENLDPQDRLQAYRHMATTWIQSAFHTSGMLYGNLAKEESSETVLELTKNKNILGVKKIFDTMPWLEQLGLSRTACLEKVDTLINRMKKAIPAKLQTPAKAIENDQTIEMEKETHTHTEKQMQLQVQEASDFEKCDFQMIVSNNIKEFDLFEAAINTETSKFTKKEYSYRKDNYIYSDNLPVCSLQSYLESDVNLKEYASAFEGIYIGINVLEWTYNILSKQLEGIAFLGSHRSDFQHLLVNDSKIIILGQEGALERKKDGEEYYNLTLGFNDPDKKPHPNQLKKIIKIKFLNGESQFNRMEQDLLKEWFEKEGVKKMQGLYMKHILKGYPQKAARYLNSPLQKLFSQLI